MKSTLFFIVFLWVNIVTAQISGDLTKDTILANQYIEQIQTSEMEDSVKLGLATKTWAIYEGHPGLPKYMQAKSVYAYVLYETDKERGRQLALEAIGMAKMRWQKEVHPYVIEAYMVLVKYETDIELSYDKAIQYSRMVEPLLSPTSIYFVELNYYLVKCYFLLFDEAKFKAQLQKTEALLSDVPEGELIGFRAKHHLMMMRYHTYFSKNYEKAIDYGETGFSLLKATDTNTRTTFALILVDIYANRLSKLEEGKKWMRVVLANEPKNVFENKVGKAINYTGIGRMFLHLKEYEKGIGYAQKAIDIYLGLSGDYNEQIGSCYKNQATMLGELKKMEEAAELYEKSLEFADLSSTHVEYSFLLAEIEDDYEKILYHLQKALTLTMPGFESLDIVDNPPFYLKTSYAHNAQVAASDKAYFVYLKCMETDTLTEGERTKLLKSSADAMELAIQYREQAVEEFDGYEDGLFSFNDGNILMYGYTRLALYELYDQNPSEFLFDRIYYFTEKRKVLSLIESLTPSKLPSEVVAEQVMLRNEIDKVRLKIGTHANDSTNFYQKKLIEANLEFDSHRSMISREYPKEANNFYNIQYATPNDIAEELDDKTLFISFDMHYFGGLGDQFNVTAIGKNERKLVHVRQDSIFEFIWILEKLNKNPLLVQKNNRRKFIYTCNQLYRLLIGPLKEELKGKSKLVIVQEGHALRVPFDILLASNEVKPFHQLDYLIRQYDISYQYSGTAFLQLKQKPSIQDGSMLAFAPVFNNQKGNLAMTSLRGFLVDSLHRGVENNRYVPLPNSKWEVEKVTEMMAETGNVKMLLEKRATKGNLLKEMEAQSYQFIHIATHGLVNMDNHRLSGLACWQEGEGDDVLLFANEIQRLDIQADLVILSSCESGVGMVIRGEGLIAINRGFFYAGAKNVIFSLWKVNDKYTSDLMIGFYKNYFETKDYSAALRQTKLDMISDPTTANPRFWAPFVLIGE